MKQVGILQVDKRQNSSVYSMNWVWWFMSVIPAVRKAKCSRIMVLDQPQAKI
jgi:hypothetical protein